MPGIEIEHPKTKRRIQIQWDDDAQAPSLDHINQLLSSKPTNVSLAPQKENGPTFDTSPIQVAPDKIDPTKPYTATLAPKTEPTPLSTQLLNTKAGRIIAAPAKAAITGISSGLSDLYEGGKKFVDKFTHPTPLSWTALQDMKRVQEGGGTWSPETLREIGMPISPVMGVGLEGPSQDSDQIHGDVTPPERGGLTTPLVHMIAGAGKTAMGAAMMTPGGAAFAAGTQALDEMPKSDMGTLGPGDAARAITSPASTVGLGQMLARNPKLAGDINTIVDLISQGGTMAALHAGFQPAHVKAVGDLMQRGGAEPSPGMLTKFGETLPNGEKLLSAAIKVGDKIFTANSHPEAANEAIKAGLPEEVVFSPTNVLDGWMTNKGFRTRDEVRQAGGPYVAEQAKDTGTFKMTPEEEQYWGGAAKVSAGVPLDQINAKIKQMSRGKEIPFFYDAKKEETVSGLPGQAHKDMGLGQIDLSQPKGRYDQGKKILFMESEYGEKDPQAESNAIFDLVQKGKISKNALVYWSDGTNMNVRNAIAGGPGVFGATGVNPVDAVKKALSSNDRERAYDQQFAGTRISTKDAEQQEQIRRDLLDANESFFDNYGRIATLRGNDVERWHPGEQLDMKANLDDLNRVREKAGLQPLAGPDAFYRAARRFNSERSISDLAASQENLYTLGKNAEDRYQEENQAPEEGMRRNELSLLKSQHELMSTKYQNAIDREQEAKRAAVLARLGLKEGEKLNEYVNPDILWNGGEGHPTIYDVDTDQMYHGGWAQTHGDMARTLRDENGDRLIEGNPRDQEDRYIMGRANASKNAEVLAIWNSLSELDPTKLSNYLFDQVRSGHINKETKIVFGETPNRAYTLKDALSGNLQASLGGMLSGDQVKQLVKNVRAAHAQYGGSTFDPRTGQSVDQGTSVSMFPGRSEIFDGQLTSARLANYIKKNTDLLKEPGHNLGTWDDKENGKTYLDVVATLANPEHASEAGKLYNQRAVWNHDEGKEIPTGGTGEPIDESKLPPEPDRLRAFQESKMTPEELATAQAQRVARQTAPMWKQDVGEQKNQIATAQALTQYQREQLGQGPVNPRDIGGGAQRLFESADPQIRQFIDDWKQHTEQTGEQRESWYAGMQKAQPFLAKHYPELANNDSFRIFRAISTIHANGADPLTEFMNTVATWERYQKTGEIRGGKGKKDDFIAGTRDKNVYRQLDGLNTLVDNMGEQKAADWLEGSHSPQEIRGMRRQLGMSNTGASPDLTGKEPLPGSYIFGGKLGPYNMNLGGFHQFVTSDSWMKIFADVSRGLINTKKKYERPNNPLPEGADIKVDEQGRRYIDTISKAPSISDKKVLAQAVTQLADKYGLEPDDVQAIIWEHIVRPAFERAGQTMKGAIGNHGDFARRLDAAGWFDKRVSGKGATLAEGSEIAKQRGILEGSQRGPAQYRHGAGDAAEGNEGDLSFDFGGEAPGPR